MHLSAAAHRLAYRPYQPVYNVGFRVIIDEEQPSLAASSAGGTIGRREP